MITRRVSSAVLLLGALFLAGSYVWRAIRPAPPPLPPPARLTISMPDDRALDTFAVSPDGQWLAYAAEAPDGRLHLFLRSVGGSADQEVVASTGARTPFFSPDGNWVAYFAHGAIWKAPATGQGTPQKVCDAPAESAGGTWTDDGRIVFAPLGGEGLMAVPSAGGTPSALTTLNKRALELAHGWPHAVPGGGLVFTVAQRGRDAHLESLSGRGARLVPAFGQAQYVSTGHLVYSYLGDLLAVPFDLDEMKTRGGPVALARGIQFSSGFDLLGHSGFAVSRTATLAWVRSSPDDVRSHLVSVGKNGAVARLGGPAEPYQAPRLSPDGRRLAVVIRSGLMTRDIRVLDATHPERVLFTLEGGDNQAPAWMPDGRLSFASNREGLQRIYVVDAMSKRQDPAYLPKSAPLFSTDVSSARNPGSWVGRPLLLAFYEIDPFRSRDVMVYRMGEAVVPVAATAANERSPVLSPDGRWVAYVSDASGRDEVYMKRLDDSSEARQVSHVGGLEPAWTREGLLYREGDRVMLGDAPLFEGRFEKDPGGNLAAYDAAPKGEFLVMLKSARRPKEIRVVKDWGSELIQQVKPRN